MYFGTGKNKRQVVEPPVIDGAQEEEKKAPPKGIRIIKGDDNEDGE